MLLLSSDSAEQCTRPAAARGCVLSCEAAGEAGQAPSSLGTRRRHSRLCRLRKH